VPTGRTDGGALPATCCAHRMYPRTWLRQGNTLSFFSGSGLDRVIDTRFFGPRIDMTHYVTKGDEIALVMRASSSELDNDGRVQNHKS
jgi:hypothetical protein